MENNIVIAIYLRISAEDSDIQKFGKIESNSIKKSAPSYRGFHWQNARICRCGYFGIL